MCFSCMAAKRYLLVVQHSLKYYCNVQFFRLFQELNLVHYASFIVEHPKQTRGEKKIFLGGGG